MQSTQPTGANAQAELARALIKALGLPPHVSKLTLMMAAGKPLLVECQCMPEIDAGEVASVAAMGGRFELVPLAEGIDGA